MNAQPSRDRLPNSQPDYPADLPSPDRNPLWLLSSRPRLHPLGQLPGGGWDYHCCSRLC